MTNDKTSIEFSYLHAQNVHNILQHLQHARFISNGKILILCYSEEQINLAQKYSGTLNALHSLVYRFTICMLHEK
jgi:hypothetical protein